MYCSHQYLSSIVLINTYRFTQTQYLSIDPKKVYLSIDQKRWHHSNAHNT